MLNWHQVARTQCWISVGITSKGKTSYRNGLEAMPNRHKALSNWCQIDVVSQQHHVEWTSKATNQCLSNVEFSSNRNRTMLNLRRINTESHSNKKHILLEKHFSTKADSKTTFGIDFPRGSRWWWFWENSSKNYWKLKKRWFWLFYKTDFRHGTGPQSAIFEESEALSTRPTSWIQRNRF